MGCMLGGSDAVVRDFGAPQEGWLILCLRHVYPLGRKVVVSCSGRSM